LPPTDGEVVILQRLGVIYMTVCQSGGVAQADKTSLFFPTTSPRMSRVVIRNVGAEPVVVQWRWGSDRSLVEVPVTIPPTGPVPITAAVPVPPGRLGALYVQGMAMAIPYYCGGEGP
jgi:hypothetical protein